MKLKALIDDRELDLTLMLEGRQVSAEIGGRRYPLEFREPEPDCYLLLLNGRVHECRVSKSPKSPGSLSVDMRGRTYTVAIVDPKRLRSGQNSDRRHHGLAEIVAPMPGKVVRVQVEAGAAIQKNVGVVVVEAMKMQNELKSPRDGVVISINVKPGDTVNAGDLLAVVE